jgi:DNA-binding LytR/AlgR family response regulator
MKAVNKAAERLATKQPVVNTVNIQSQTEPSFIFIKDDKVKYRVDLQDFLYAEAVGNYIKIITTQKVYLTNLTMKTLESWLPANLYPRVHKSYLISLAKISNFEGNIIRINQTIIPIGQS